MKEYNNHLNKLGYTIRKWREFKDIKQQELAQRIGKDKSWLSHVENGKTDITFTQVIMIANAININPSLLFEEFSSTAGLEAGKTASFPNNFNDITALMKDILYSMRDLRNIK